MSNNPALRSRLTEIFTDTRGLPVEPATMATRLRYSVVIRRLEFLPVVITVALVPTVLGAHSWRDIASLNAIAAVAFVIFGHNVGNMVNSLADRDEDALFKSRTSTAVYGLGVSRVVGQIILWSVICFALAVFLGSRTQHWDVLLIALTFLVLSVQYSIPPLHFKSSGILQLPFLQFDTVFLPGLLILRAYDHDLEWGTVITVAGLALSLVALFSVSHAEDYLEDEQFGLRTYVLALGLTRTFYVTSAMLAIGAVLVISSVWATFGLSWAFLLYVPAWLVSQRFLFTVLQDVRGKSLEAAIAALHKKSPIGAYYSALVGWSTLVLAIFVLIGR